MALRGKWNREFNSDFRFGGIIQLLDDWIGSCALASHCTRMQLDTVISDLLTFHLLNKTF